MAIILPANTLSAGGYTVANSCRFNSGDSPYMHKTPGGAGNRRTFTLSYWIKTSEDGYHFTAGSDNFQVRYTGNTFFIGEYGSGSYDFRIQTNRLFRDPSAWLNIVVAVDTTQGTSTNRVKIYVNGVQETSFSTSDYPSSNYDTSVNNTVKHHIGVNGGISSYTNAYLAEVCLVDGSALAPTSFGEFDEDSPTIWKPIDVSGLTFGTNGFYLDFEDSSNLGNDANGGTDLTEVNLAATDQATDSPTNNFSTLNPLIYITNAGMTLSEGNCKVATSASAHRNAFGTFGVSSGKWYWEIKIDDASGDHQKIGVVSDDNVEINKTSPSEFSDNANGYAYRTDGQKEGGGGSVSSFGNSYTTGDIISVAMDLTNLKLYFAKNGTWQDSGDPTSGATGTGSCFNLTANKTYFSAINQYGANTSSFNFGGSPAFTISSGNADGNGYGNFEYAPPSGFYSLCTKNLAEYG